MTRARGVPVRNTRGQRWPSVRAAADHFGLSHGHMSDVVRTGRPIGGWRLMRADPNDGRWKRQRAAKDRA